MKTRISNRFRGIAAIIATLIAMAPAAFAATWFCPDGTPCGVSGSACHARHRLSNDGQPEAPGVCPRCQSSAPVKGETLSSTHTCLFLVSHVSDGAVGLARTDIADGGAASVALPPELRQVAASAAECSHRLFAADSSPPVSVAIHISSGLPPPTL